MKVELRDEARNNEMLGEVDVSLAPGFGGKIEIGGKWYEPVRRSHIQPPGEPLGAYQIVGLRPCDAPEGKRLYGKYLIPEEDGEPLPKGAVTFTLRLDSGEYVEECRKALAHFCFFIAERNPRLAGDISTMLFRLDNGLPVTIPEMPA